MRSSHRLDEAAWEREYEHRFQFQQGLRKWEMLEREKSLGDWWLQLCVICATLSLIVVALVAAK